MEMNNRVIHLKTYLTIIDIVSSQIPQNASIHRSLAPIGRSTSLYPYDFCIVSSEEFIPSMVITAPSPIELILDQKITFTLDFNLGRNIELGSKISFQVKKLGITSVTIPCLEVSISLTNEK